MSDEIDTSTFPRERIETDGVTTNLWHRQHEWYLANVVPKLSECDICGGVCPYGARHELCRIRQGKGMPIVQLNTAVNKCYCTPCAKERGER